MNELVKLNEATLEKVLIGGDLSALTPNERVSYYLNVCNSIGVNPATKPFSYIVLNGKLTLYANRDCADQLRKINNISIEISNREVLDGTYLVTAKATANGRTDESIGAVYIEALKGQDKANAMMKSETKAKRRVTLSISGLGFLDETEIQDIADVKIVDVAESGEIKEIEPVKKPIRPFAPEKLADLIAKKVVMHKDDKATDVDRKILIANLNRLTQGDDALRHALTLYLAGHESTKEIDDANVLSLNDWMNSQQDSGGDYVLDGLAVKEYRRIVEEVFATGEGK